MWSSEPKPLDPRGNYRARSVCQTASDGQKTAIQVGSGISTGRKTAHDDQVFKNAEGERIIAAKGAPEAIIALSDLWESQKTQIVTASDELAAKGYRILGIGQTRSATSFPSIPRLSSPYLSHWPWARFIRIFSRLFTSYSSS